MRLRWTVTTLALCLLPQVQSFANDDSDGEKAAKIFTQGKELLHKGDFEGALKAYGQASKLDSETPSYRQNYLLLRRIIKMRQALAYEADADKWMRLAGALKNFYYSNRLYEDLLGLASEMHAKKKSSGSASLLADAQLILGRNAEAVKTLAALPEKDLSAHAHLLMGIGLGRLQKLDQAKAMLNQAAIPAKASPRMLYDVARLQVLCGEIDKGMATLTAALESTAPMAQASFRSFIKNTPDFSALPASANFAKVLLTKSKVAESSCSGGKTCGSCPSKGSCGSGGSCSEGEGGSSSGEKKK